MADEDKTIEELLHELRGLRLRVAELERSACEREQAEKALAESERRYRLVTENASDIIWTMSLDGQPLYVSPSITRLTGYSIEEAMAVPLERQLRPASYAIVAKALAEELASANRSKSGAFRSRTLEVEIVRKDGSTFWAEAHVSLIPGPDGRPVGIAGVTRDISERKWLEQQLRHAQKMETIGRLAGGVAHDFNNVLTGIIGYASFARAALPNHHPAREDIDQVLNAAERAGGLTRQLLAFSRSQTITLQVFDLNGLLLDLDRLLRHLIGEDIELVTIAAPDLGLVRADPGQIEQALVNLAVNARDAMPGGGVLTIETANVTVDEDCARRHPDAAPGEFVMLATSDTGIGMSEEVKAHLFEPFFTTKEPGEGTGLGLATLLGIVKQHQGSIWAYSEPGRGTTFKILLPRVGSAPAERPRRDKGARLPQGNETVLIVEDEALVRNLAARTLRELGYTVLQASNGEEALRVALETGDRIHLLLTDVVMPKMGGTALATQLEGLWPGIRALFISGYTVNTATRHGIPEGAAFLEKPFSTAILAHKVREVLDA